MVKFKDANDFMSAMKSSDLVIGIDNDPISDDNIADIGKEIWRDIMNTKKADDDNFCTFREYMNLLSDRQEGFEYEILYNSNGVATGCAWQTSVMHEHFELFGGYICLDVMGRKLNKLEWPYMVIVGGLFYSE